MSQGTGELQVSVMPGSLVNPGVGVSCVEVMVLEMRTRCEDQGFGWLVHRDLGRLGCRSEL